MKTYPYLFLLMLATGLIFSACKKEEVAVQADPTRSLRDFSIGDKFAYKEIHIDFDLNGNDPINNKDCRYGDRILYVEVMEKIADGYILKEYLSTQSADEVGTISLTIKNDRVDVVQLEDKTKYGESLFHHKTFNIAQVSAPMASLEEDCFQVKAPLELNEENGYAVADAIIQGAQYQDLYAYYFGESVPVDGPSYTYLFNQNATIIRSTTLGSFFPYFQGWELIPN